MRATSGASSSFIWGGLRGTSDFLAPATFVHLHTPFPLYAYGWVVTETAEGLHVELP